jgi:hypothetical protein
MQHNTISAPLRSDAIRRDIDVIACRFAKDETTRQDLRQEMLCHLLALPTGKVRAFYMRSLARRAHTYWERTIVDAPLGPDGRAILERRTICVGGLRELDQIHRRQAA